MVQIYAPFSVSLSQKWKRWLEIVKSWPFSEKFGKISHIKSANSAHFLAANVIDRWWCSTCEAGKKSFIAQGAKPISINIPILPIITNSIPLIPYIFLYLS